MTNNQPVDQGKAARKLTVSVVQFRSGADLAENTARHCDHIRQCAKEGARVVVFPECSVTSYDTDIIVKTTRAELAKAESTIASAAKEANVYAIVGGITRDKTRTYNSAVVFAPTGKTIERYHKVQLAGEPWATPGDHLSVFPIDGVLCSIIICHDERYPELVRLPVLAGARLVFYISHESGMNESSKIEPYRAQIVARAVENTVYIAHANAPGDEKTLEGSHGQSRIITPTGHIIREAGIYNEEVVTAELDLGKATGACANNSPECAFLGDWWKAGVDMVVRITGV